MKKVIIIATLLIILSILTSTSTLKCEEANKICLPSCKEIEELKDAVNFVLLLISESELPQ